MYLIFPKKYPKLLNVINSYKYIYKISLCGLYSGTFKASNYGYWHYNG